MSWRATILTLFPEAFPGVLGASLPGKALKDGVWALETLDIRSFSRHKSAVNLKNQKSFLSRLCGFFSLDIEATKNFFGFSSGRGKHASVDDTPYGGGAGMVMRADVLDDAIRGAETKFGAASRKIYLSPRGRVLNQALVKELAAEKHLIVLCGRYEGVDQRVIDAQGLEEISLGDFVLAGGEVAAMAMIEACVRLLPGVLGNAATVDEESFGLGKAGGGLLEYPHYTKPAEWQGMAVPEVLTSGHHEKIKVWRREQAEKVTQERRPDLYEVYVTSKKNAKRE